MVIYLPTILMNMINQATNYIPTDDKYELVYTINMYAVLQLVFLSLSLILFVAEPA